MPECLFLWPVSVCKLCLSFSGPFSPPPGSSLRSPSIPVELPSWFSDRLFWAFKAKVLHASDGSHPPLTGFNYLSLSEFPWQLDPVRGLSLALGKLFVGPRLQKIHGICFRFELLGSRGQPTASAEWLTFLARGWWVVPVPHVTNWICLVVGLVFPFLVWTLWTARPGQCLGRAVQAWAEKQIGFLRCYGNGRLWAAAGSWPLDLSGLCWRLQNGCG